MTKQQTYIDYILTELRKGNVVYNEVFKVFLSKFKCSEPTFVTYWNKANEIYLEAQHAINEQKSEIYQSEQIEAFKTQIKSKTQRLISYQVQIEYIEKELETGKTRELVGFKEGKAQMIERELTIIEKNSLRKTLKELQSEISKIEGDYAPTKVSPTDKDGNDLKYNVFSGSLLDNLTN